MKTKKNRSKTSMSVKRFYIFIFIYYYFVILKGNNVLLPHLRSSSNNRSSSSSPLNKPSTSSTLKTRSIMNAKSEKITSISRSQTVDSNRYYHLSPIHFNNYSAKDKREIHILKEYKSALQKHLAVLKIVYYCYILLFFSIYL
jgi:hypothetical protein